MFSRRCILALIVLLLIGVSLLVPSLQRMAKDNRTGENANNLKAIFQLLSFRGYDGRYYIGLTHDGRGIEDISVQGRFRMLFDKYKLPTKMARNPVDRYLHHSEGGEPDSSGNLTNHYSYSMLQLIDRSEYPEEQRVYGRRSEWKQTWNDRAAILSDRIIISEDREYSVWNEAQWEGHVLWNSGRVSWETSPILDTFYGGVPIDNDHLFRDTDGGSSYGHDAYLIHSGE